MKRAAERTQVVSGSISCRGSIRATAARSSPQATFARPERLLAAFRVETAGLALADSRGSAASRLMGGLGGRRQIAHNVTAAADYRTALLSDSP